jgi:hypothetical protein
MTFEPANGFSWLSCKVRTKVKFLFLDSRKLRELPHTLKFVQPAEVVCDRSIHPCIPTQTAQIVCTDQ